MCWAIFSSVPATTWSGWSSRYGPRPSNPLKFAAGISVIHSGAIAPAPRCASIANANVPIACETCAARIGAATSPAAGWIKQVRAVNGAIQGRIEWTPKGKDAVEAHEYRYVSPVFEYDDEGRVVRLLRAALTNNPNLNLPAIASAESARRPATERPPRPGAGGGA